MHQEHSAAASITVAQGQPYRTTVKLSEYFRTEDAERFKAGIYQVNVKFYATELKMVAPIDSGAVKFELLPKAVRVPAVDPIPAPKAVAAAEPSLDPPGQWVNSDNGDLSLRLRVKSARIATKESVFAVAEIRNNRAGPVTILRPFGDHYYAKAVQLKIWGEKGQVKYTGDKADYDLGKKAFVTLGARRSSPIRWNFP